MTKKQKKYDHFMEEYLVRFNTQLPDGFWKIGCEQFIYVPVKHGINEKNNHDKAKKFFLENSKFKCEVTCVEYV